MNAPYPASPAGIPADLARPTTTYRRHAYAAVAALLGFILLYVGLTAWFGLTAWRLVSGAWSSGSDAFMGYVLALPALFLFAFLVKGLFFVRKGQIGDAIEVRAQDEPALFAFLHRVADESGAPRPHRVFLTPDVNASVFYDLSVRNLVWPSKKNLNIGLGLVNVLTLDELKAVLAHEFGHFAQRTMAVGTWVYVASHAIGAIVARRDGFDRFLDGISGIDLRIAWIGWLMRLVVWSIRVVLDTAFRGLVVVQRALSREMEFQADLVSVSLCGSDSLVHALRRLGPADDAMNRAMAYATKAGRAGTPVADLYSIQTLMLDRMRQVWNDPALGTVPPRPDGDAARHRVFTRSIAEVPRMWATHPPSHEREENAKRVYVPSPLDERPAWVVFADAEALRRRLTAHLYAENMPEAAKAAVAPEEDTRKRVVEAFSRPCFEAAHRGVYVGRSAVRGVRSYKELYGEIPTDPAAVGEQLDAVYPDSIVGTLRAARDAEEQVAQLEALAEGVLSAPGGVIHFRGRTLRRRELPAVLDEARAERDGLTAALVDHDRGVRTAHRAAARALGKGWEPHLVGLGATLHYLEHLEGNVQDAHGVLQNVIRITTADGKVSSAELDRIVAAANEVQEALATVYQHAEALKLSAPVLAALEVKSWKEVLAEELGLPVASRESISQWLEVVDGWVASATRCLDAAGSATLDVLLEAEAHVARCFRDGTDPGDAPAPPLVPVHYPTAAPGQERPRQKRLDWWDRFQTADGWLPGAARLGAASAVLAPAIFLTQGAGTATVVVHNGLDVPLVVDVGEESGVRVPAQANAEVTVPNARAVPVEARTEDGRVVEHFEADAQDMWATYVYNVASADVLGKVWVGYGTSTVPEPVIEGTPRWLRSTADYTFVEAPDTIEADAPTLKVRLVGLAGLPVPAILGATPEELRPALALTHVRWDAAGGGLYLWALGSRVPAAEVLAAVRERGERPDERVAIGRLEQDLGDATVCDAHQAAAAAAPDDGDAAYLAIRCLDDAEGGPAFRAAAERFPDHPWIGWALAWEQMRAGEWAEALATVERVRPALDPIRDQVVTTRLRLLRRTGAGLEAQLAAVRGAVEAAQWEVLLAAEAGEVRGDASSIGPWDAAILARARGDLAAAERKAAALQPDAAAWHRWMNAGSDGAGAEQLAAAAQHADAGVDGVTVWVRLALLARDGGDRAAMEQKAKEVSPELFTRLAPVYAADPADVPAAVESAVAGADAYGRAWILLVGTIRLGDGAPEAWRREARELLLPWERPYLRGGAPLAVGAGEVVGGGVVGVDGEPGGR